MKAVKTARPRWRVQTRLWQRLLDSLQKVGRAALVEVLGPKSEQLRFYLRRFLELLAKHGSFAWGGRVAYSLKNITEHVTCSRRTAQRIVAFLRDHAPGLAHVHLVQPGELAWDGTRSVRKHYEFTVGALWRETVATFEAGLERPQAAQAPLRTTRNFKRFFWLDRCQRGARPC